MVYWLGFAGLYNNRVEYHILVNYLIKLQIILNCQNSRWLEGTWRSGNFQGFWHYCRNKKRGQGSDHICFLPPFTKVSGKITTCTQSAKYRLLNKDFHRHGDTTHHCTAHSNEKSVIKLPNIICHTYKQQYLHRFYL